MPWSQSSFFLIAIPCLRSLNKVCSCSWGGGKRTSFFCTLLQNIILICFCHCHPEPLRLLWQLCLSPEEAPKTIICASVQKSPPNSFLFLQNLLKAVVFSRIFFTTLRKGGSIWLSQSLLLFILLAGQVMWYKVQGARLGRVGHYRTEPFKSWFVTKAWLMQPLPPRIIVSPQQVIQIDIMIKLVVQTTLPTMMTRQLWSTSPSLRLGLSLQCRFSCVFGVFPGCVCNWAKRQSWL